MSVGVHTVTVAGVDISCLVDSVAIHHGREDSDSQPEASSCTLEMSTDTQDADLPPGLDVGAALTVTTNLAGTVVVRFSGKVTDISQGWDEAGDDTPDMAIAQVIATGTLADLGRRTVGDTPWPQQLDGARVSAIMAAAGVTLNPATSDPGTVQILARDIDSQPALDLAQAVAADAGGLVWVTRNGEIRYADADHRRGTQAALVLDACDVLVTPTWRRTTEGLVNDVSIGYGVAPDGADQPRFTGTRQDSVDKWGEYALSSTTQLAALADATAMGNLLLTRNHEPVWVLAALPIDMARLTQAETVSLLSLELGDLITVTGMPAAGNVPTTATLWVEGWSETLAWGTHDVALIVSGYCRSAPAPRWNDLDPAITWDGMAGIFAGNYVWNPTFRVDTSRWNPYSAVSSTHVTLTQETVDGEGALRLTKNQVSANLGANTGVSSVGLTARPTGTQVTIACEAKFPVGTTLNRLQFIARDDANGDSAALTDITDGALMNNITADGAWHRFWVTGTVKAARNLERIYLVALDAAGAIPIGTYWNARRVLVTDGPLVPYFDGATPDDSTYTYDWTGAANASSSTKTSGITWDDATCLGPQPNRGRWDDVAATLRWNGVASNVTWDTWNKTLT